ncbi:exodeoxyribonuclease III [Entomobacter blattae]|uniref:Exodeoxyribonuclease III n=1 Tax=Entomobacter blattae TaxID=2762277 RepID=A0A7H1NUB8_9PROT|nr:exodeoxyribonuclease III [Entomobacter blattae]QNT79378.1 Exodeoxyribonuclease III [Entomobacter blattae]
MKIATWNVNSIRQRITRVEEWLKDKKPDILLMQEIKCETHLFPDSVFESLGYQCYVLGQKSYNGVAIISRLPAQASLYDLPHWENPHQQTRYIEITLKDFSCGPFKNFPLKIGNLYAPNGNSGGEEGLTHKLSFFESLYQYTKSLMNKNGHFLFAGDYNICPTPLDYAPQALSENDALRHPLVQEAYKKLIWSGLTDILRAQHPSERIYTFWDYQKLSWERNIGMRIDHFLLSPTLAENTLFSWINKEEREKEKPSDHVPVMLEIQES